MKYGIKIRMEEVWKEEGNNLHVVELLYRRDPSISLEQAVVTQDFTAIGRRQKPTVFNVREHAEDKANNIRRHLVKIHDYLLATLAIDRTFTVSIVEMAE